MPDTNTTAKAPDEWIDDEALRQHSLARGKIQVVPRCAIGDLADFAVWYTPGVAAPCRAIRARPELVYEYTNRGNCVAIVTDGTRVLGLGDIGPTAGLPVMEGKALLFKYLGGVDAVPLCLATRDPEEFVRTVEIVAPSFGGINLEDIAQPKCFRILEALRPRLEIPVWHDDQQGTAAVALAALLNALRVVGKEVGRIKIALIGVGAAGVATYRLLRVAGADPAGIVACDRLGTLHARRHDLEDRRDEFAEKWQICLETNRDAVRGGIAEALRGADACIAFAQPGPDVIAPEWIRGMARDAVVFACANPVPELWPQAAREAGARIVGTGRGDFPNQVNNALAFPAIFRGTFDVRARAISDEMTLAAAKELAACAADRGVDEESILPRLDDPDLVPRVAVATAMKAQDQGLAQLTRSGEELRRQAAKAVEQAQAATRTLMREGLIPIGRASEAERRPALRYPDVRRRRFP